MKQQIQIFNFSITNQSDKTVDVHIDGDIVDAATQEIYKNWFGDETSVSFKSFRNSIESSDATTFNVFINSPGGQVIDAMAIHDLLVDMQAKGKTVNTIGRGLIASAATYILMAGKNPQMSENSWLMIHNVAGAVWGDVNQVEGYAKTLRKFNDSARDFYTNKTGMKAADITKMMDAETWMTAKDAQSNGFINSITNAAEFTNFIDKDKWNFTNTTVLNSYNSAVKKQPASNNDDMKKIFADLQAAISNAINGVKPQTVEPGQSFDQQAFINSIATAVSAPFETIGETMETSVNEIVNAAVTTAVDAAVATAVTNATTPLLKQITELEEDVAKKVGVANKGGEDNAPKAVGSFS